MMELYNHIIQCRAARAAKYVHLRSLPSARDNRVDIRVEPHDKEKTAKDVR